MKMRHALWQLIKYRPGLYAGDVFAWIAIFVAELGAGYLAKLFFSLPLALSVSSPFLWER